VTRTEKAAEHFIALRLLEFFYLFFDIKSKKQIASQFANLLFANHCKHPLDSIYYLINSLANI